MEKTTLTFDFPPAPPPAYAPHQNTNDPNDADPRLHVNYDEATHTTNHSHQPSVYELEAPKHPNESLAQGCYFAVIRTYGFVAMLFVLCIVPLLIISKESRRD
jgi:hypothetical protein